jgi:carbonic anhydrase
MRCYRPAILSVLCLAALSAAEAGKTPANEHAAPADATHNVTPSVEPGEALSKLTAGNARFVAGQRKISTETGYDKIAREKTAGGQHPFAGILTCADSRLSPEIIFDQHLGELFVVRNAGNIAEPIGEGSMEYGVEHLGIRLILVLGHTKCGAVAAVGGSATPLPGNLAALQNEMAGLRTWVESNLAKFPDEKQAIAEAVKVNARRQADALLEESPVLREAARSGKIKVVAGVYNLATGAVELIP